MSFGDRLQILRHSNGLTQEQFAQQLNVSRQAVSKWESSRGYPEIEKIIYICNHYGVTMDELFLDEVPPARYVEAQQSPASAQSLETPPLKRAFGNFFANLSPHDQKLFGGVAAAVLILLLILFCLFCAGISKGEDGQMALKLIWLGLLVLFTVGEAFTVGLTSIWFAAGSLAALICALLKAPLWLQIGVFLVVSTLALAAFRPIVQKYFNSKVEPTNADRIIGSDAIVVEEIHNIQAKGAVRVGGMIWSARSEQEEIIPAGTLVRILRIEGVKVYVKQVKEEHL